MKENNKNNNINEVWAIAIVLLYFRYERIVDFEDFKKEIIYNNRFFPKHNIIDVVKKQALNYKFILKKDAELYRSRIFKDDFSKQEVNGDEIVGYDEKNSMAPNPEIAKAGRANPEKISYLYTSEDINTSIKEVRPMICSFVSVAEIKTLCDLTLFDISNFKSTNNDNVKVNEFFSLNYGFSAINHGNDIDYIPTQYIAELLKNLGFDGIKFESSLNKGGINITLFNHQDTCKFIKSKLYFISDIDVKYSSNIEEFVNDLKI